MEIYKHYSPVGCSDGQALACGRQLVGLPVAKGRSRFGRVSEGAVKARGEFDSIREDGNLRGSKEHTMIQITL